MPIWRALVFDQAASERPAESSGALVIFLHGHGQVTGFKVAPACQETPGISGCAAVLGHSRPARNAWPEQLRAPFKTITLICQRDAPYARADARPLSNRGQTWRGWHGC